MLDFNTIAGVSIPFVGTTLGAAMVFFMKDKIHPLLQKALLGFSSGVMMAASVWSLLIPAMDLSTERGMGKFSFLPAISGLLIGILLLLLFDRLIPHLHLNQNATGRTKEQSSKNNYDDSCSRNPQSAGRMAVGAVFAGLKNAGTEVTLASAFALSVGIAIQNFPEGAIISMPLKSEGISRRKSFLYGTLSGLVEPFGAIAVILLSDFLIPLLPYLLSFAAGAMIYVIVEEIIPEASEGTHSNIATIGFAVGFCVMMILDVALG